MAAYLRPPVNYDDFLLRIEWIRGVGHNTSVPSDPEINVHLVRLPADERKLGRQVHRLAL